jgi:hypothetical protein
MRSFSRRSLLLSTALTVGIAMLSPASADETTGSVYGRITTSGGVGTANASVTLLLPNGVGRDEGVTGFDGFYRFPGVRPGRYKLMITYEGTTRYAHERPGLDHDGTFTVQSGRRTRIDERMSGSGALDVKIIDALNGEPVATACAAVALDGMENCDPDHGRFRFTGLARRADYVVDVRARDGLHMPGHARGIAVEPGHTTEVTIRLDPAAVIATTVLDRGSHRPVPWACVLALPETFQIVRSSGCGDTATAGRSDVDGAVRIGPISAGTRRLFVDPQDGEHGVQWVGRRGGTGVQRDALRIDVVAGRVAEAPPILLDPYGSLSGSFTDPSGRSLRDGTAFCATVMPQPAHGLPPGSTCGTSNGTFTITGLGPYRWPVGFSDPWNSGFGVQWPGGSSRESAPTYQVTAGTVTDIGSHRLARGRAVHRINDESQWFVHHRAKSPVLPGPGSPAAK